MALSEPAGWAADELPFDGWAEDATAWLSPDEDLGGGEGFVQAAAQTGASRAPARHAGRLRPGRARRARPRSSPLKTLLVTGDSLAMPLDVELARRLTGDDVKVDRDAARRHRDLQERAAGLGEALRRAGAGASPTRS